MGLSVLSPRHAVLVLAAPPRRSRRARRVAAPASRRGHRARPGRGHGARLGGWGSSSSWSARTGTVFQVDGTFARLVPATPGTRVQVLLDGETVARKP